MFSRRGGLLLDPGWFLDLRRDYFHAVSSRVLRSSTCECINKTYLKESVSDFVFPSRSSKIKFWCGTGSLVALSRTEFEQIRNFDRYRIHGLKKILTVAVYRSVEWSNAVNATRMERAGTAHA